MGFFANFLIGQYRLTGEAIDIRATAKVVEIFRQAKRCASHTRRWGKAQFSTFKEHMPKSHQAHLEWTPSRILTWAGETGPGTKTLCERILSERPHPQQGFRACLGILRLGKAYTAERLEKAALRAIAFRSHSYGAVDSILKKNLESQPLPTFEERALPAHQNIRGPSYFN